MPLSERCCWRRVHGSSRRISRSRAGLHRPLASSCRRAAWTWNSLEQSLVVQALERSHGNQTKAAALLGMNRDQIRYRIEKFGLTRPVVLTDCAAPQ